MLTRQPFADSEYRLGSRLPYEPRFAVPVSGGVLFVMALGQVVFYDVALDDYSERTPLPDSPAASEWEQQCMERERNQAQAEQNRQWNADAAERRTMDAARHAGVEAELSALTAWPALSTADRRYLTARVDLLRQRTKRPLDADGQAAELRKSCARRGGALAGQADEIAAEYGAMMRARSA